MNYHSTKDKALKSTLKDAVLNGIAPDGGLFMPQEIRPLPASWFQNPQKTLPSIAYDVARQFLGEDIPSNELKSIVSNAMNFDVKMVEVGSRLWCLELFHGPTLAFKDFGARFLAGVMEYFAKGLDREIVVLAATSGD